MGGEGNRKSGREKGENVKEEGRKRKEKGRKGKEKEKGEVRSKRVKYMQNSKCKKVTIGVENYFL